MDLVKVILLGAPSVGKTSIIQQFVWNNFSDDYSPTLQKHAYFSSVIINDRLYELKLSDVPVIPYFPVNSYYEWSDFRCYGLRNATAYILVFDLSNVETFQYVRMIREQMFESRDMRNVPLLIVGNKQDLLLSPTGGSGINGTTAISTGGSGTVSGGGNLMAITSGAISGAPATEYREKRRDIVTLVKKHWKCGYVECSAKYNWHVVAVFKDLMHNVNTLTGGAQGFKEVSPMMENFHEALDRNKCCIL